MNGGKDRAILWLSAGHLVTDIYLPAITAIIPVLVAVYGYSYLLAGSLVTVYNVSSSATQPLFGWLSDQRKFQVPIPASLVLTGLSTALIGLTTDYRIILLLTVFGGLGHASFHPNALSRVDRLCTGLNRGQVTAIFVVGGNLGYAVGPLLTGLVVTGFGLPGLLFLLIPAAVVAVPLVLRPASCETASDEERNISRVSREGHLLVPLITLFGIVLLRAWVIFAAIAFFPSLLMTEGFDLVTSTLLVSLMLFAGVAGQVVGGRISDRYGRKEFVITGMLVSIPALAVFLLTTGPVAVAALLVFGFALWSGFAVTIAMSHELVPGRVGLISGVMLGLAVGAGGAGVAVIGGIADQFSLHVALAALPVLIVGSLVLAILIRYPWKSFRHAAGQ